MPELPEVETFARQIRPRVLNKKIVQLTVTPKGERMIAPLLPEQLSEKLVGTSFSAIKRHGKFLIFELSNEWHIVAHLRMSGRFTVTDRKPDPSIHNRLCIRFADDSYFNFLDIRRFGTFHLIKDSKGYSGLQRLGADALDSYWTGRRFHKGLHKYNKGIYKVLLDQNMIAGIGNIYANEALYASKIHPLRAANSLSLSESSLLLKNIIHILSTSLEFKGTTLIDDSYKDIEGGKGEFAALLKVYAKAGKPCSQCGSQIEKERIAGRSVFYCPSCQLKA